MILMAFADEVKNRSYKAAIIPETVQSHQLVAGHYGLPFINLAKQIFTEIQEGKFSWDKDFKDLHPAPFGQQLYFKAIKQLLTMAEIAYEKKNNVAGFTKTPIAPVPVEKIIPIDPYNYREGEYLDVRHAANLKGFMYHKDWTPEDQAHVRPGFVHIAVLEGRKPGDRFTLNFKGNALGLAVLSGPDAGVVRYRVDGTAWKYLDLYTQWSSGLHLPWYKILADELGPGQHQVEVEVANRDKQANIDADQAQALKGTANGTEPRGTAVRIAYFLVNKDSTGQASKIIYPKDESAGSHY